MLFMDWIAHNRQLYGALDREITSFFTQFAQDPSRAAAHLDRLLHEAKAIGGRLVQDVEALNGSVRRYLVHPSSAESHKIQQDALRIKHEVREL